MILTEHNCVFVHIPKTGGSSVRFALGENKQIKKDGTSHLKVRGYIEMLGGEKYRSMFSFAFVRNPWDRMVSLFTQPGGFERPKSRTAESKKWSFTEWVMYMDDQISGCKLGDRAHLYKNQIDFLVNHDGVVDVTYVGRFENLLVSWRTIRKSIGLSHVDLPWIAKSRNRKPYQAHYDVRTREIVGRLYGKDVEYFGYEF